MSPIAERYAQADTEIRRVLRTLEHADDDTRELEELLRDLLSRSENMVRAVSAGDSCGALRMLEEMTLISDRACRAAQADASISEETRRNLEQLRRTAADLCRKTEAEGPC